MFEPTTALQTAIRSALLVNPELLALVPTNHIREGSTRPDKTPCIIMADSTTTLEGHDYKAQRCATVHLDLHIWTIEQGQALTKEIAGQVIAALDLPELTIQGGECDHFRITSTRFMRDPDPQYGHGILSAEAVIRWTI